MSDEMYKKAGVDINRGVETVRKIKEMAARLGIAEIGKFGGFYPLPENLGQPVLVSSADGVGTKLKIAFQTGIHDTIGIDLVNHCVNDILVYGARPLFFLDYIATGKLSAEVTAKIVSGMMKGCSENGFVLLGGETAEMPGFYSEGEYDVAGFIVGLVDRKDIIDGRDIRNGDYLVGLPSSGLHTNGYSLARYIVFDLLKLTVDSRVRGLSDTVGSELLKVHRSYLKQVNALVGQKLIKGMAHITGGGFLDNLPRILPDGIGACIDGSWPVPDIFSFLIEAGGISSEERFRVFNMGIGMVLVVAPEHLKQVEAALDAMGEAHYLIGKTEASSGKKRVKIDARL